MANISPERAYEVINAAYDPASTAFRVSLAAGSSDGAIVDGVSSSIKATVLDYTNSNPLATRLVDSAGTGIDTLPISAASLPLPSGASTVAAQTTGNTSLATLAGAVAGTEMQVDVLTMPTVAVTGTFWQATQPVSLASVPSHAVTNAGTFAVQVDGAALTSLQLIDDAIYASDGALSKTMGIAAVFDDVATVAITENQAGYLRMSSRRALLVEGVASGTAINVLDTNSAAALTALQLIDNAISGAGFNITQFNGEAIDVGAGTEAAALRVTLPTNGTGILAGVTTVTTVTTVSTVTAVTAITNALPAGTNAIGKLAANSGVDIGDVDVTSVNGFAAHDAAIAGNPLIMGGVSSAAAPASVSADQEAVRAWYLRNGAAATVLTAAGALIGGDAANGLDVDVTRVSGTVTTTAVGTIADDATTPGAPVMVGGKAVETDGTDPTSVSAEDDVAIFRTDRNRRLLVNAFHPNTWSLYEDHTTAQTNNQLKAAPGAGLSLYVTDVVVSNGATAGTIKLVEDETGTPVQISQTIYMPINGGAVIHWNQPRRLTANKTLGFTSATVTTHSIEVHGFIAP